MGRGKWSLLTIYCLCSCCQGSLLAHVLLSLLGPPRSFPSKAVLQVVRFQPVLLPGAFPSQVHGCVCSLVKFLQVFVCLLFLPEWIPLKCLSCSWVCWPVVPQFDITFRIEIITDWNYYRLAQLLKRTSHRIDPCGICLGLTLALMVFEGLQSIIDTGLVKLGHLLWQLGIISLKALAENLV